MKDDGTGKAVMKVVRLSARSTGRLYSPGDISDTHFCWGWVDPKGKERPDGL